MQNRFYITLISAFFCAPAFAQNVFLAFSNLAYHEIIPLQTDSMYIVNGTQRKIGIVGTQSPEEKKAPSCGMPNPLAFDALSSYVPLAGNNSTPIMEVFSMDGRLISSQDPTLKAVSATMAYPSLWYLVVIRDEKNIICVQKMCLN